MHARPCGRGGSIKIASAVSRTCPGPQPWHGQEIERGATLMMIRRARRWVLLGCSAAFAQPPAAGGEPGHYDVLISGGPVYDGLGGAPVVVDVGSSGDRLADVGPHASGRALERLGAH